MLNLIAFGFHLAIRQSTVSVPSQYFACRVADLMFTGRFVVVDLVGVVVAMVRVVVVVVAVADFVLVVDFACWFGVKGAAKVTITSASNKNT